MVAPGQVPSKRTAQWSVDSRESVAQVSGVVRAFAHWGRSSSGEVVAETGDVPMKKVSDSDFDALVLKSELPVLVDFSAVWCGPCRAMEPVLAALATEYEGKLLVLKADVDAAPQTAARFMIHSVPTFLFFQGGQVVKQLVGAVPKPKMTAAIEQVLQTGAAAN